MSYKPMLARVGDKKIFSDKSFFFEPKMDGTRGMCFKEVRGIELINRRGVDIFPRYPEFVFQDNIKANSCVLDGEVVVYDPNGVPSFRLLQGREQVANKTLAELKAKELPATYVVFDIISKEGEDLTRLPLSERKKILEDTVSDGNRIQKIFFTEDGAGLWKEIVKRRLEGVIAKKIDGEYLSGIRSPLWLKIKYVKTIDCIIVGYTSEKRIISALVLAVYKGGKLTYIGRSVGKGFTLDFLEDLKKQLEGLRIDKAPVEYEGNKDIRWVRPKLVCEVEFLNMSKDYIMRAPVFLRLRPDKKPEDCVLEDQVVL
jgi:bifunctional non-homologous end joining protein LigD